MLGYLRLTAPPRPCPSWQCPCNPCCCSCYSTSWSWSFSQSTWLLRFVAEASLFVFAPLMPWLVAHHSRSVWVIILKRSSVCLIIGSKGSQMWKQHTGNYEQQIFWKCRIWPLAPVSKRPYISLIVGPRASKYEFKTTCKRSWNVNLLQVSNLIFDPCFKVKWDNHTKMAIQVYVLYIGNWIWNSVSRLHYHFCLIFSGRWPSWHWSCFMCVYARETVAS